MLLPTPAQPAPATPAPAAPAPALVPLRAGEVVLDGGRAYLTPEALARLVAGARRAGRAS